MRSGPIVILTGAGISKESGLDTFRDLGGIWSQVRLEEVATPEAFRADPIKVHGFYNARRAALATDAIAPNAAHHAIARLQAEWPEPVLLVTQNVDDLHDRAGSTPLIHMHGELKKVRCNRCDGGALGEDPDAVFPWDGDLGGDDLCPRCSSAHSLRPHVVWFGEVPLEMERIQFALLECALFISIGTSGTVYPAAGFVQLVRSHGLGHTVELNLEPTDGASVFAEALYGPATQVVPVYVERLLQDGLPAE